MAELEAQSLALAQLLAEREGRAPEPLGETLPVLDLEGEPEADCAADPEAAGEPPGAPDLLGEGVKELELPAEAEPVKELLRLPLAQLLLLPQLL